MCINFVLPSQAIVPPPVIIYFFPFFKSVQLYFIFPSIDHQYNDYLTSSLNIAKVSAVEAAAYPFHHSVSWIMILILSVHFFGWFIDLRVNLIQFDSFVNLQHWFFLLSFTHHHQHGFCFCNFFLVHMGNYGYVVHLIMTITVWLFADLCLNSVWFVDSFC